MNNFVSVEFPNKCPNCGANTTDEDGYNEYVGHLPVENDEPRIRVVYVICKKCDLVRTFRA